MEALTSFGPAGAVVAVVWLFFRYLVPAIDKLSTAIDANTKATTENHKFMKNLNGELKAAAQKKLES